MRTDRTILGALLAAPVALCAMAAPAAAALDRVASDAMSLGREGPVSLVDAPRRAGAKAFKHTLPDGQKRAELADGRVALNGTYWYGWSFMHPASPPVPSGGWSILMQMFVGNRPADSWPCGGAGHKIAVRSSKLVLDLQHSTTGGADITCRSLDLAMFDEIKDRWVDVVINAKWTAAPDGFVKVWLRIGGAQGSWLQKVDYKGRSQADGAEGPYFKMGAYTEGRLARVVYTDEYRRGGASSSFEEVAPGEGTSSGATPEPDGGAADARGSDSRPDGAGAAGDAVARGLEAARGPETSPGAAEAAVASAAHRDAGSSAAAGPPRREDAAPGADAGRANEERHAQNVGCAIAADARGGAAWSLLLLAALCGLGRGLPRRGAIPEM